jgi:hypothetical protein
LLEAERAARLIEDKNQREALLTEIEEVKRCFRERGQPVFERYALLREGLANRIAIIRVRDWMGQVKTETQQWQISVNVVERPDDLDWMILQDSSSESIKEDPASRSAWNAWLEQVKSHQPFDQAKQQKLRQLEKSVDQIDRPLDKAKRQKLRQLEKPFDQVVRPQYSDGRFHDVHVGSVLRGPYELLTKAIDRYRVDDYRSLADLRPSRVVTVLGARGAGKTHLLESLQHREDGATQLIVTRKGGSFDKDTPFGEYLFDLLLRALLDRPGGGTRLFDLLAGHVARLILVQALRALGPTERLFAQPLSGWAWLRLLCWGGGEEIALRFDALADDLKRDLADPGGADDVARVARRHQFHPRQLESLAQAHLRSCDKDDRSFSIVRRELYSAMLRAALLGEAHGLNDFLEADYRPSPDALLQRDNVVRDLLHAIIEVCALVRLPVVFAFDNLEGLLAPSGALDTARAAAFLDGLVQAVDHVQGFLCLVFAEQGLFLEARKHAGSFVPSRLDQGVSVPNVPTLTQVEIPSPSADELLQVVRKRMDPIRKEWPGEDLDDAFPFPRGLIQVIGARKTPMRTKLEELRQEYQSIVFGEQDESREARVPEGGEDKDRDPELRLRGLWNEKLTEATDQLNRSQPGIGKDLTWGLGELLQVGRPLPGVLAGVKAVHPAVAFGDDPRYGHATVLEFDGSPPFGPRVAIGFLLASTQGMKIDLQAKLDALTDKKVDASFLIVLWATQKKAAVLPKMTGEAWRAVPDIDRRACLRVIDVKDMRRILAFHLWYDHIQQQSGIKVSAERVRKLAQDECGSLFALATPPTHGG